MYRRKLWQRFTLKLEQFVALAVFQDLAFDLSLSALLGGGNIYNFGELLGHPVRSTLVIWFVIKNCAVFIMLLWVANQHWFQNDKKLLAKINVLCLMEIIFSRPPDERTIRLSVIAEQTKLTIEDV